MGSEIAILALFGATAGEPRVVWRAVLRAVLPVTDGEGATGHGQILIATALLLGTPFFIIFGWLSDKIGRKPHPGRLRTGGRDLLPDLPGPDAFHQSEAGNRPASAPVTVVADPSECSFQFNPVGVAKFTTSCDIAKSALVARSVNYQNQEAPKGTKASVKVGDEVIQTGTPTSPSSSVTRSPSTATRPRPIRRKSTTP